MLSGWLWGSCLGMVHGLVHGGFVGIQPPSPRQASTDVVLAAFRALQWSTKTKPVGSVERRDGAGVWCLMCKCFPGGLCSNLKPPGYIQSSVLGKPLGLICEGLLHLTQKKEIIFFDSFGWFISGIYRSSPSWPGLHGGSRTSASYLFLSVVGFDIISPLCSLGLLLTPQINKTMCTCIPTGIHNMLACKCIYTKKTNVYVTVVQVYS